MPRCALRSLFEQTQLCKFHQAGFCKKGKTCNFAHSQQVLRMTPNLKRRGTCDDDDVHSLPRSQDAGAAPPRPVVLSLDSAVACTNVNLWEMSPANPPKVVSRLAGSESGCSTNASLSGDTPSSSGSSDRSGAATPAEKEAGDASPAASVEVFMGGGSIDGDFGPPSAGNADADLDDSPDSRHRVWRSMFRKTRMCRHLQQGLCRKGLSCNFAHSPDELRRMPDPSYTTLCTELQRSGRCGREGCAFAHSIEELRPLPQKQQIAEAAEAALAASGTEERGWAPSSADSAASSSVREEGSLATSWQSTGGEALAPWQLCVKNTFVDVKEPQPCEPKSRSRSAPCRLVGVAGKPADGATEVVPLARRHLEEAD